MKALFIRVTFFLCIVPALVLGDARQSSVLVVYDAGDPYALPCFEQIIVTLEYNRIPYTTYDLSSKTPLPPLGAFLSVITTTEMIWKLDPAACDVLKNYVRSGGGLAVFYRGWNQNLRELLGIQNTAAPVVKEQKRKGLRFTREFIPGITGTTISEKILADISAYDIQTLPTASVFAVTPGDNLPAAWVNTFGSGKVVYWNCTILSEKIYRGLVVPTLAIVQPVTCSLIMNLGVVCLDDFPNASPNVKVEPIKSEFNMTVSEFYAFQWYPDMMKLARQYGIHYTAALIFGYAEITTPPYTFSEWARSAITRGGKTVNASIWLTHEAQDDIEVGFHGQNHQPLTLANWKSSDNMKLSLQASQQRWQFDNLGPAPQSYIPPMNVIDSVGMNALTDVLPTIRVIGSQFMGKFEYGQNREFGTDPWNSRIISIPRITSGFIYDDFNRFLTLSELQTVGAWTHFVHPDDIIPTSGRYAENTREDLPTENLSWLGGSRKTGLFYQFEKWIAFVKRYYPWLRFSDYAHAYDIVKTFETSTVTVKAEKRLLTLRFNAVPNYCVIHLDRANAILTCSGAEIVHASKLSYSSYYVVHVQKHDVVITLRDTLPAVLYRAGTPKDLYIAGNSRYNTTAANQIAYPKGLPSAVRDITSKTASAPTLLHTSGTAIGQSAHAANTGTGTSTRADKGTAVKPPREDNTAARDIASAKAHTEINPRDVNAWHQLREAYARNGHYDEAVLCDEHIVKLLPNDTSLTKALARQYVAMDKKERAIPLYEAIVKRHGNDAQTWFALYELYSWSDRPKDAVGALAAYLRARPDDEAALQKLAEFYVGNDRQMEAIPLYEKLVARRPEHQPLRMMLAQLYTWNNFHNKAAREFERLSAMSNADSTAADKAIREYQAAGQTPGAVRILEEMLLRAPDDTARRKQLIALFRAAGDNAGAIGQSELLLKRSPGDVAAMQQLGEMLLWQDRQADAIGIYERIVKAAPDSLSSRIMLARLYSWNKRPTEGLLESKRILRRDPNNTEALRLLAAIDRARDNWFDARAWYTVLLERQPHDSDATGYLDGVRRNHGLLFTSSYERIDDSNDLQREELPVRIEMLQTHTADYFLNLRREGVQDNRVGRSALGYGAGLGARFSLGTKTSVTLEALATRYDSDWVPITAKAALEHTFGERVSVALRIERSETVEGIQAIRSKIYTTSARGELYVQATDRWSVSGLAEFESYTDDNLRSTGEILSAYKLVLRQPQITLQASSIYQDTKRIYPSSQPYWTPSGLMTTSVSVTLSSTLFGWFTPEIAEGGTVQGGVFSNTFGAKAALQLSQFLQLTIDYGKVGSTVYRQNVARASVSYRY